VAHGYNHNYLRGKDLEGCGSRPAWAKSLQDPISTSKKTGVWWHMLISPARQEAVGRRIKVLGWPLGKKHKTLPEK
jgi:hypothetical protein